MRGDFGVLTRLLPKVEDLFQLRDRPYPRGVPVVVRGLKLASVFELAPAPGKEDRLRIAADRFRRFRCGAFVGPWA